MRKSCSFHDFDASGWPSPDELKKYFSAGGRFWASHDNDSWALRAEELRKYRTAVDAAVTLMRDSRPSLDEIRRLAGPSRVRLERLAARAAQAGQLIASLEPPAEGAAAHSLLKSAVQFAARAAESRRQAILKGEMKPAWEASSAAAGSLIFFDRAVEELQALARIPAAAKPRT